MEEVKMIVEYKVAQLKKLYVNALGFEENIFPKGTTPINLLRIKSGRKNPKNVFILTIAAHAPMLTN